MSDLPTTPPLSHLTANRPRDQRWLMFGIVIVAVAGGLIIGGLVISGDDDESSPTAPPTEISSTADLAGAETTAVRLVEAANREDCATVRELATERVANEIINTLNCNFPEESGIEVAGSRIVGDDPVTVAVNIAQGDEQLTIEVELIRDAGGAWRADNFDAVV